MQDLVIKNSDGDFLQIQNYILQLVAEKKLTQSAFLLYSFYRSIAGFSEIRCGYNFISLNSGISKGSITSGNKLLQKEGLIKILHKGRNSPFEVVITPGATLPRREFKKPDYDEINPFLENINKQEILSKAKKKKVKLSNEHLLLKDAFIDYWKSYYHKKNYHKKDDDKLLLIDNPAEAVQYIPVLWSLDEVDTWIKNSDHSITIFVKEILSHRLETYYPNTKHYYLDRQNA